MLVLNPVDPDSPEAAAGKTHTPELFVAPRADNSTEDFFMSAHYGEYWVGPRAGLKEMQAMTGIETHDIAQLADALSKDVGAEAGAVRVRVVSETDPEITIDGRVHPRGQRFRRSGQELRIRRQAARVAAEARMVKDGYEINEMRKAVDATKHGFDRLLSALPAALDKPRSERILEGAFNAVSRELGNAIGYDSIVASGPHAPILHWMRNTGVVKTGDMLLVDAGVRSIPCTRPTSPAPSRPTASSPTSRSVCTSRAGLAAGRFRSRQAGCHLFRHPPRLHACDRRASARLGSAAGERRGVTVPARPAAPPLARLRRGPPPRS